MTGLAIVRMAAILWEKHTRKLCVLLSGRCRIQGVRKRRMKICEIRF